MPTPYEAPSRPLPFPLDRAASITGEVEDIEPCGLPTFPEDSDEKITVLFRLSLNQFVALATAVDVGSDIAYGTDGLAVWWTWVASVMCASFCEEMATCFEEQNEALMIAVANAIQNNPLLLEAVTSAIPEMGGAVPGRPITTNQAAQDTLPANVKDEFGVCINDALWGACLYLVQSGNRAITDFFEILESASNTLEATAIVAQTIPAAGPYASAAAEFADQLAENLAEGYSGAYTEDFEEDLACALFCAASEDCELSIDRIIDVITQRLPDASTFLTFQALMVYTGETVFVGPQIADIMFAIYFNALRFGQQFAGTLGIRPLTDLMSLGADQLASDNWEVLCDCSGPEVPNISLRDSFGGIPTFPTFIANSGSGSIWECTYFDQGGGAYAVPVTPQIGGIDVCCTLISATPVVSYQHLECGGGLQSGSGDGASPPNWAALGFISGTPGTVTIELQPV